MWTGFCRNRIIWLMWALVMTTKNGALLCVFSFNFQDDILTREQRRPDGADREGTLEFHRWDFQLNQNIIKKLSVNANVSNIFNQPDRSVRLITGYYTELEYYGYMAQIGLKYQFLIISILCLTKFNS